MTVAQRLAKHERFEWSDRMVEATMEPPPWRDDLGARDCPTGGLCAGLDGRERDICYDLGRCRSRHPHPVPDLADAGTAGVLLATLHEAWSRGDVDVSSGADGHEVFLWVGAEAVQRYDGDTLGEAVALALLAVWGE